MGAFFIYILKSSVCLVLFYLFFRVLLSKETFHRFNRVALLGVLFLSLLIPFIEVTTNHQVEVQQTMLTIEQVLLMAEMEPATVDATGGVAVHEVASLSWIEILLLVYLAGIIFFACRNLYSLIRLFRLIHSGKREKLENGTTLVVHEQEIAPFSWMKYIVISRKDLEENGREILIHEAAHIRHRHSIDLLVADICIFFQWFNPGAWLLKQELQNIHEYEADETVINEGVNAKEYQLLLIKKAVGTRLYSMANSFNHSKLKKRITMMLKEKSNPWARLKYLYVLPLAAIAVTAFARPEISEKVEEISAVKVNDLAEIVQENVLRDTENVLQDTVKVSHGDSKAKVSAENRAAKTKGNEELVVFEVVEQMPEYPGGMNALYKYLENKTKSSDVKGKAGGSVIVGFTVSESGKVKDVRALQSDQPILTKEAERIVSEMPAWIPGKQRGMPVSVKYSVPVRFGDIRFPENKKPLIMVDGKEMSMETFEKIDRGIIESFSVLKDSASIGLYGKRGANGVILVTTRREGKTRVQDISTFTEIKATETNTVPDFLVTGIVTDEQGQPKAGVSIVVPNTTIGAITDANGRFRLKTPKDSYLWFSFIGYKTVKAAVASEMSIRMEQDVVKLFPETSVSLKTTGTLSSGTKVGNSLTLYGVEEGKQPLIIINDKEVSDKEALSKIAPDRIKSANGVILVTTRREGKTRVQDISTFTEIKATETNTVPDFLVTGIVTDEQGQPKAGVSIVVPNTTIGAITDANGRFRLKTPKDSYLWFSFIGYKTVKAAVASEMSIRMEQDVVKLFPETSVSLKTTGTLSSGTKVGNSLTLYGVEEGKQPLIIINDKEVSDKEALSKIAPDRIKSFSILKDKTATSIYGEKGKNGVIIVTLLTEGEYQFKKDNPEKPYADALELAESVAEGVEGKIIYCIDDDEVEKSKLKGMSIKTIKAVSLDQAGKEKIVRLKTDKYRSDWITVTGVVYNEDEKPTSAIVNVRGTRFTERTDSIGRFTIKAPKNGVLLVGYNGKPTIEVKVKPTLKVILKDKQE